MAAVFPLIVVVTIRARRAPDDRLNASILDTITNVLGIVSLSVMLTLALDTVLGSTRPLGLTIRLWLFALFYLGLARAVLVSARRQAMRSEAFSVPTLIVGAGMIGTHLAMRLFAEPGYGLRPWPSWTPTRCRSPARTARCCPSWAVPKICPRRCWPPGRDT